jgi:hypothetical protein
MSYIQEVQSMVGKLGPNGKAVYDEYIERFPDALDEDSVVPITKENTMCIILGNREPFIMKDGLDISEEQRDNLIDTICNW